MQDVDESTAVWFHRPSVMTQSLFQVPLLGYLNGAQAIWIFGVGMPLFFVVLSVTGDLAAAIVSVVACVAIAMARSSWMSYESRLLAIMAFGLGGGKKSKPKKAKRGRRAGRAKKGKPPAEPEAEPLAIRVSERPIDISIRVPLGLAGEVVHVQKDGRTVKSTLVSSSGTVAARLDPATCSGDSVIAVHSVLPSGEIDQKPLAFKRMRFTREEYGR